MACIHYIYYICSVMKKTTKKTKEKPASGSVKFLRFIKSIHKDAIYLRKKALQEKTVKTVTENDAILSFIETSQEFEIAKKISEITKQ